MFSKQLSSAALAVLSTQPACQSSLASCLSLLRESLASVTDVYDQPFKAQSSLSAASESESHVHIREDASCFNKTVLLKNGFEDSFVYVLYLVGKCSSRCRHRLCGLLETLQPVTIVVKSMKSLPFASGVLFVRLMT
ncbi:hypothetical protein Tco_1298290 [Tanacetum coccineum]